ncbi:MAG: recombinase family protein [Bacteroidota bacterium]
MKKAIIYTRVSTDEQANHGYSLNDQKSRLEKYCEIKEHEIVQAVKEDYSAKTFDRPEFRKLLDYIKANKGRVDLLLVLKWDRFSRNATDALNMIRTLGKYNVEVNAIEQPIDLSVPENKLMLSFYVTAPEVENDRRSLNVIKGMRRGNLEGRYLGPAPKGYINNRDEFDKAIILPSEEASLVVEAFEMMATGLYTQAEILKTLNQKGIKCGKTQFSVLLHNRLYTGKVYVKAGDDEPEQWVNGIHKPLITEELFQKVQDVMSGRLNKRSRPKPQKQVDALPLRSFLICPKCGKKLTGSKSKGNGGWYFYYHCNACKVRYKADDLNFQMDEMLESVQILPEVKDLYLEIIKDLLKESDVERKKEIKKCDTEIQLQEERIMNITDLLADGKIESAVYSKTKARYEETINRMTWEKSRFTMQKTEFNEYLDWGFCLLQNIKSYYSNASVNTKQKIIGSMYSNSFQIVNGELRTEKTNALLGLIALNDKGFGENKTGQLQDFEKLSRIVPEAGIEPARV